MALCFTAYPVVSTAAHLLLTVGVHGCEHMYLLTFCCCKWILVNQLAHHWFHSDLLQCLSCPPGFSGLIVYSWWGDKVRSEFVDPNFRAQKWVPAAYADNQSKSLLIANPHKRTSFIAPNIQWCVYEPCRPTERPWLKCVLKSFFPHQVWVRCCSVHWMGRNMRHHRSCFCHGLLLGTRGLLQKVITVLFDDYCINTT